MKLDTVVPTKCSDKRIMFIKQQSISTLPQSFQSSLSQRYTYLTFIRSLREGYSFPEGDRKLGNLAIGVEGVQS